jgi:hypothetical protein
MVEKYNVENKRKLMSVEKRFVDVEEIVGDLDKIMDSLDDFYLKFDEWRWILEEVTEMRMPK